MAGQPGVLVRDGEQTRLDGAHPALGQGRVAVTTGSTIEVQSTSGDGFGTSIPAPGADAVAVSDSWVAWRVREGDGDAIYAVAARDRRAAARDRCARRSSAARRSRAAGSRST